jgi:hypothetical protein
VPVFSGVRRGEKATALSILNPGRSTSRVHTSRCRERGRNALEGMSAVAHLGSVAAERKAGLSRPSNHLRFPSNLRKSSFRMIAAASRCA